MAERRSPWRKAAFAGCGCVVAVALIAGGLVASNWRAIGSWLNRNAADMAELAAVQRAVVSRSRTPQVQVRLRSGGFYSMKEGKGRSTGTRLVVTLTNAPLFSGKDLNALEPQAREIALVARGAMRDPSSAPGVDVELVSQVRLGVTVAKRHVYRFAAEDLERARLLEDPSGAAPR